MPRVLVVLRSPDDVEAIGLGARHWGERGGEMAVCHVRPAGDDELGDLALQRQITRTLRMALGEVANDIAVFVIGDSDGDDLDTLAATWGADLVVRDGESEAPN